MTNAIQDKPKDDIPVDQLSYEQAYTELQTIVGELESEGLLLDEALALFERGQELIRYCINLLDQTELKVQQILGEEIVDFETQVE
ncbi:MAG: exodeoxyribonuclease VII small subunit [Anaerolineales bacterium]|nr:exodeoxyribonuclease VII small subunit [Anaerolineales bacterium]